ncbi:hypothetical protein ACFLYH_00270 [Candidatus Dependentiae bacterium]
MIFVVHRINSVQELKKIPKHFGVEIDLRDKNKKLILQHDPFKDGEDFEEYLQSYGHGLLILNIKSERIEFRVLELLKKYNIKNYFFLDSSFPMIYTLSELGEKNIAIRFSEFEGIDTILAMKSRINWVWVDCFTQLPLNKQVYKVFKENRIKTCLVSPELQGRDSDIKKYKNYLLKEEIQVDIVCTKIDNVDRWDSSFVR